MICFRKIGGAYLVGTLVCCSVGGGSEAGSLRTRDCLNAGYLCTWAGTGEPGFDSDGHGLTDSMLYWPMDITFTSTGEAYVLDWNNHAVRVSQRNGTFTTVIGSGFVGDGPPGQSDREQPGADGRTIDLNHPTQIIELPTGKMLLGG